MLHTAILAWPRKPKLEKKEQTNKKTKKETNREEKKRKKRGQARAKGSFSGPPLELFTLTVVLRGNALGKLLALAVAGRGSRQVTPSPTLVRELSTHSNTEIEVTQAARPSRAMVGGGGRDKGGGGGLLFSFSYPPLGFSIAPAG